MKPPALRKVLIVSPHFPPVNAADHQRVRHVLPYLRDLGWEPTVLAIEPSDVAGAVLEPRLLESFPPDIEVVRTRAVPLRWTRPLGMSTLGLRALPPFWQAGARLLSRGGHDLAFFSTTQFSVCSLGPVWRKRLGVPYVLDFQDPWLSDYQHHGSPPGGWKFHLAQWQAARLEPRSVRGAARLISVSPKYLEVLGARYGPEVADRGRVLPFATSEEDFHLARQVSPAETGVPWDDGCEHFVYVGRGGDDMAAAARLLFRGLQRHLEVRPERRAVVRLHFIGTSYAPPGQGVPTIRPLAESLGLEDVAEERVERIAYYAALRCLLEARGILLLGSDDPAYSASKIHPCLLAGRPLLALTQAQSPATALVEEVAPGCVAPFGPGAEEEASVERVARWFESPCGPPPGSDWRGRVRTAAAMARELVAVFEEAISPPPARSAA